MPPRRRRLACHSPAPPPAATVVVQVHVGPRLHQFTTLIPDQAPDVAEPDEADDEGGDTVH